MEAKSALGDILFILLLPLSEAKGKGGKPFGLTKVQLRVAEFFALRGSARDRKKMGRNILNARYRIHLCIHFNLC